LIVAAAATFAGIVTVRHGPPSGGDTTPLTAVTTDLAHGDLRAAAAVDSLPDPPGYALLTAPLVAAFPGLVGTAPWCTPTGRLPSAADGAVPVPAGGVCGTTPTGGTPTGPPWYRSQGVLGVAAWLALAFGGVLVLRAAGVATAGRTAGFLVFAAVVPSASSAVVQLYHPQDVLSLGAGLAALAVSIRRRYLLAGVLFGLAFLTKQSAVLLLVPALATAGCARDRWRTAWPAVLVAAAGLLPFALVDPRATADNLSGFSGGGAVAGATLLSISGVTGSVASAVARDAPVVLAVALCLWAGWRHRPALATPSGLVSLALACVGSRLVVESVVFPYYLLSASVLFLLADLVDGRLPPARSLAWCGTAAFFVALRPDGRVVDAVGTFVLAVAAVAAGVDGVRRPYRRGPAVPAAAR
jgi:hypothetical protein